MTTDHDTQRVPSGRDDGRTGTPCLACGTDYRTCTDGLRHFKPCCPTCGNTDTHSEQRTEQRAEPDHGLILWRWTPDEQRWTGTTTPQPRALLDAMLAGINAAQPTAVAAGIWAVSADRPTVWPATDPRPYRPLAVDDDLAPQPTPNRAETLLLDQLAELPPGARVVVNIGTDGPAIVGPDRIAAGVYRLATDLDIRRTGDHSARRATAAAGAQLAVYPQKPADQRADIMRADGTRATAAVADLWAALEAPRPHDTRTEAHS